MNHRTVLWTLVLFGSVAAAHGQTPGNSFQATLDQSPSRCIGCAVLASTAAH
jgi:hypothetical protein